MTSNFTWFYVFAQMMQRVNHFFVRSLDQVIRAKVSPLPILQYFCEQVVDRTTFTFYVCTAVVPRTTKIIVHMLPVITTTIITIRIISKNVLITVTLRRIRALTLSRRCWFAEARFIKEFSCNIHRKLLVVSAVACGLRAVCVCVCARGESACCDVIVGIGGVTRGMDCPGWHPPGGDTRRKKICGQIYKE